MNILKALVIGPLCGLFFCLPAQAQKTKAQLNTEITTTFPDNTVGQITPTGLRLVASDITNSIMPTAPVVAGNLACFNGTTGLLQDCGSAPATVPLAIGVTPIGNGTTTRVIYDNAGILGEYLISGTGNVCMTTSCAMTTPNLGTPSAATLTNAIGLPANGGLTGTVPVTNGGTGGGVASGTLLDNIAGFSSTGLINRTGAGAYGFAALPLIPALGGTGLSSLGTSVAATLANNLNATGGLISPTPTRAGDIVYWNGSTWVTLAGNNSGTLTLQENASGVPSWASVAGTGTVTSVICGTGLTGGTITTSGTCATDTAYGGRKLIATLTASSSATLSDTTSITASFNDYDLVFENVLPATNAQSAQLLVHSNSSFPATSYTAQAATVGGTFVFTTATTFIPVSRALDVPNTTAGLSGTITLYGAPLTTAPKNWSGQVMYGSTQNAGVAAPTIVGGSWNGGNTAIDGFQFNFAAGNIASGQIKIYGRK